MAFFFETEVTIAEETYGYTRKREFAKHKGDKFVMRTLDATIWEERLSVNFVLDRVVHIRMSAVNVIQKQYRVRATFEKKYWIIYVPLIEHRPESRTALRQPINFTEAHKNTCKSGTERKTHTQSFNLLVEGTVK